MTDDFEAHIARQTNEKIREVAERLDDGLDEVPAVYEWFCGCGCMSLVPGTLASFLAEGAWVDGHKPE